MGLITLYLPIFFSSIYVFETKAFPQTAVSKSTSVAKNQKTIFQEVTETAAILSPWRNCHIMNAVLSLKI